MPNYLGFNCTFGQEFDFDCVIPSVSSQITKCNNTIDTFNLGYHSSIYIALIVTVIGIGILGVLWNISGLCVLTRPSMKTSLNMLMIVLCLFDLVNIIVFTSVFIIPNALAFLDVEIRLTVLNWKFLVYPYAYPIARIATFGSTYFTVLITLERFCAVCKPLQVNNLCSMKRTVQAIIFTVVGVFLYNLPRLWKLRTVEICKEPLTYDVERAESGIFATEAFEIAYYHWGSFVTFCAIPFGFLVYFNGRILFALKNQRFTTNPSTRKEEDQLRSLAYMLFCIVGLSLIVVITDLIVAIIITFFDTEYDLTHFFLLWYDPLLVVNSALNFVFYCIFGKKFRREMLKLFCPSYASNSDEAGNSTRTMSEVADAKNALELEEMVENRK